MKPLKIVFRAFLCALFVVAIQISMSPDSPIVFQHVFSGIAIFALYALTERCCAF